VCDPPIFSGREATHFSIFAGVDYQENELLPLSDLSIPIMDIADDNYRNDDSFELYQRVIQYLEGLVWMSSAAGANWEGDHSTLLFVPGYGTLANHHSGMNNIEWHQPSVLHRDGFETRGEAHPGRGAYSPYDNMTMKATRYIPAGMELFANLGDTWETNHDSYYETLHRGDYDDADAVIERIRKLFDEHGSSMEVIEKQNILDFVLNIVLDAAGGKRAKLIRSLIPDAVERLENVTAVGGTFAYRNRDLKKPYKWLKKRGLCVDNLTSGKGTVEDAGRGAFASRDLKEGAIVAPVPLIPILRRELLDLYPIVEETHDDSTFLTFDRAGSRRHQLLLNYCFGHEESDLLLLPSAPLVNMINHHQEPNVELMWSSHDYVTFDHDIHDLPLHEWDLDTDPQIVMVLVAKRNISEGEEVFVDYGPAWVEAWKEHQKQFGKQHADLPWPDKALDVRPDYRRRPYITDLRENTNPYPESVFTACFIEVDDAQDGHPRRNKDGDSIYTWTIPDGIENYNGHSLLICDLQKREPDALNYFNYTVLTRFKDSEEIVEVKNVPHDAIYIIDKPGTGDIHQSFVFRHPIAVADDHFPQAWRNRR